MQVYGGDDSHIGLSPLPTAVRCLRLEQFEGVKTEIWLGYLERFAQYGARLVLNKQQCTVGFSLGDFLEQTEEVDVGEEEARCVVR